jgi:hypothetical protein
MRELWTLFLTDFISFGLLTYLPTVAFSLAYWDSFFMLPCSLHRVS